MSVELSIAAFLVGAVVSLVTSWVLVSRLERVGELKDTKMSIAERDPGLQPESVLCHRMGGSTWGDGRPTLEGEGSSLEPGRWIDTLA